jgi:hypothetical protein
MKQFAKSLTLILVACTISIPLSTLAGRVLKVGQEYDVTGNIELRSGPGEEHSKKINQKASKLLKETQYLSVDESTTVSILRVQGNWAEIQVVEPPYLRDSHKGWIPVSYIKTGAATKKLDGWIKQSCIVYRSKSTQSEYIGYLSKPASVAVADDGSGWLKLIHGPVMNTKSGKFLELNEIGGNAYIEGKNFSTLPPYEW